MNRPDLSPLLPLEVALNAVLQLDPASREALTALEGRVLQIRCTEPLLTVYLLPGKTPRLQTQKPSWKVARPIYWRCFSPKIAARP